MKASRDNLNPPRREIFILTSEEKKTIAFVLIAFVLGLATKYYRDRHPPSLLKPEIKVRGHPSPKPSRT